MHSLDYFSIWAGMDVPLGDTGYSIHQPKLSEIASLGEATFFEALSLVLLNKFSFQKPEDVNEEELFLHLYFTVMNDKSKGLETKLSQFLLLLFPEFTNIVFYEGNMVFIKSGTNQYLVINQGNFDALQKTVKLVFFLGGDRNTEEYNPGNDEAQRIADKLKRGRMIAAKQKGELDDESNFLTRFCSILAVGLKLDIQTILNYTFVQFKDMLNRFHLYENFNISFQCRIAGSSQDIENWEVKII